jgi:perosamine synthetase
VTWRRIPPVNSPVRPGAVLAGQLAALGVADAGREQLAGALCATFGARRAILAASGTHALTLALRSIVPPGEVVAMPAYACIDLTAAAIGAGVRVALYDVDPDSLGPRPDSLRATLDDGARAVLVAPLYGYPPDLDAIVALARERGVPVIEDAAQSAASTFGGRRVGGFGDLSVLSFGRGKGTTGGSGGALLIHGQAWQEAAVRTAAEMRPAARGHRDVAVAGVQWLLARPNLYALPARLPFLHLGEMVYKPPTEPAAMSAAAVRMARVALAIDALEAATRREHAAILLARLTPDSRHRPVRPVDGAEPGFLRLPLMTVGAKALENPSLGVLRGYPITLDEHPETRRILAAPPRSLEGAVQLRDRLVTAPTHSRVSLAGLRDLGDWLASRGH